MPMLIKNESSPHPDGFNFHLEDDNQTISFGDSGDSTLVRYHGLFQHENTYTCTLSYLIKQSSGKTLF